MFFAQFVQQLGFDRHLDQSVTNNMDCHLPFKRQWICAMTMGQTFWCPETRGKTCFSAGISLSKTFFFESLLIDQNFTGWNTIKRSFHKKFALYDFHFYIIYIFWQFERNHQYDKVWIGYQEQNNVFSWQSGAETTFTSWEDGKSPCYFFKTYLQVFHTNM